MLILNGSSNLESKLSNYNFLNSIFASILNSASSLYFMVSGKSAYSPYWLFRDVINLVVSFSLGR